MSSKLLRVGRKTGAAALLAALALLVSSWIWRGYAPRRILSGKNVTPLAISPANDVLVARGIMEADPLRFLSPLDGSEVLPPLATNENQTNPRPALRADYSPDGKKLAVLQDGILAVFDLATRDCIIRQTMRYFMYSGALSVSYRFSPDSSFIVWCSQSYGESPVVVWDLAERKERLSLPGNRYPEVSPDSRLLATITDIPRNDLSAKLVLKLWNARSGELERSIPLGGSGYQLTPSFSPDGRLVAATSVFNGNSTVEVFDVATGNRVFEHKGWNPRLLADGKTLAMVWGQDVQLWDTSTWQLKRTHNFNLGRSWDNGDPLNPHPQVIPGQPRFVVFGGSPTRWGKFLRGFGRLGGLNAFGSIRMTLIDVPADTRTTIELHQETIEPVFSQDGTRVALAVRDGNIALWDLPPRRSFAAPICAVILVLAPTFLLLALRRRKTPELAPITPDERP